MASEFLDTLTFPRLIAPIPVDTFLAEYWEKKPLIVHRNHADYYGDLLTLEDFDRHVAFNASYVKSAEAKTKSNKRTETDSTEGVEHLLSQMWGGHTLVLDQLQQHEPKLARLCRILQRELGYGMQTNCYLTPPNGAGFTAHWDNHDVFVLQVFGAKKWKVEHSRRRLPGKSEYMKEEEGREIAEGSMAFTLKQGDLIYIPRGTVHAAECGADPSLHITLGVNARTWDDLLYSTIGDLIRQDDNLRLALPPGYMTCSKDKLAKRILAILSRAMTPEHVDGSIDRFRDIVVAKTAPDISGQVTDFFRPPQVHGGVVIQPRRGTVCTMYNGQDAVQLNYAGRSITFPDFFKPALVFALNTPSYAVGDLPGDIEEEEKIAFIERLLQEGLVVRA